MTGPLTCRRYFALSFYLSLFVVFSPSAAWEKLEPCSLSLRAVVNASLFPQGQGIFVSLLVMTRFVHIPVCLASALPLMYD